MLRLALFLLLFPSEVLDAARVPRQMRLLHTVRLTLSRSRLLKRPNSAPSSPVFLFLRHSRLLVLPLSRPDHLSALSLSLGDENLGPRDQPSRSPRSSPPLRLRPFSLLLRLARTRPVSLAKTAPLLTAQVRRKLPLLRRVSRTMLLTLSSTSSVSL